MLRKSKGIKNFQTRGWGKVGMEGKRSRKWVRRPGYQEEEVMLWRSGVRGVVEVPGRPQPRRTLPPRGLGGGSGPHSLTWPPAAAGSPATWRPSGPSPPWTRRPSGLRAARARAPWSPGAAALRRRPLPWCGQGSASPSDPAPSAHSRHATAGSSRRATAHFRWGERESVTRAGAWRVPSACAERSAAVPGAPEGGPLGHVRARRRRSAEFGWYPGGPATRTSGSRPEDVGHREGRLKWDFGRLSVAEDGKIWTRRQESAWKKGFLYIGEKEGLPKVKYLPRGVLKFYCISESPGRAFRQPVSPDHNTHQLQGTIRGWDSVFNK